MEKYGEGLTVATAAAIWVIDDSKDWELDVKNRKE